MECPVCSNSQFKESVLIPTISVKTCLTCGLLISDIERQEQCTGISRINDEAYDRSVGRLRRQQAAEMVRVVEKHKPAGSTWLDIRCGFGHALAEARGRALSFLA